MGNPSANLWTSCIAFFGNPFNVRNTSPKLNIDPGKCMPNVVDITGNREADLTLVASLVSVSKLTRAHLAMRLARIGLKPGEDEIICAMEDGNTKSVAHLASMLNTSFSTTVRCLADLERRGYVT